MAPPSEDVIKLQTRKKWIRKFTTALTKNETCKFLLTLLLTHRSEYPALPYVCFCDAELALVIALKLVLFVIVFYTSFFCILSVLTGAFSIVYDASVPFDYKNCCSGTNRAIVVVLGMELNFFLCSFLFIAIERAHVWDYALFVSLAHFILSCIVIREAPDNWQWWLAFLSGSVFMVVASQVVGMIWERVCWKDGRQRGKEGHPTQHTD